MKIIAGSFFISLLLLSSTVAFAVSDAGQYYITQMTRGGPQSIRGASNAIIQAGETDTQVLDTLAEVMLQNYKQTSNTYIDAIAWATRALAASGNPRYRTALGEVAESKQAHRKLRKYAKKAIKQLGKEDAEQYMKGSVDLAAIRAENERADEATAAEMKKIASSGDYKPITAAITGMSQAEVIAICGPPTNTTSHMTGKQFRPFNFSGADTLRSILLYKGQGRVILSNDSHYSATYRVLEVLVNPNESGYP